MDEMPISRQTMTVNGTYYAYKMLVHCRLSIDRKHHPVLYLPNDLSIKTERYIKRTIRSLVVQISSIGLLVKWSNG
jgi:hypothetical protein